MSFHQASVLIVHIGHSMIRFLVGFGLSSLLYTWDMAFGLFFENQVEDVGVFSCKLIVGPSVEFKYR